MYLFGDIAGAFFNNGIFNSDLIGGNLTVTQGNGYSDLVTVGSSTGVGRSRFNNATITQGNSTATSPPLPANFAGLLEGDTINFNDTDVISNLTMTQGTTGATGRSATTSSTSRRPRPRGPCSPRPSPWAAPAP